MHREKSYLVLVTYMTKGWYDTKYYMVSSKSAFKARQEGFRLATSGTDGVGVRWIVNTTAIRQYESTS